VPHRQLSEAERDLTVRPVHPLAQECGGYQNPTPPATAVSRGFRVLNSLCSLGYCPNPRRGRGGRRLLSGPRPPSVTPWVPRSSGFERLAAFESQQVDEGCSRNDRHGVIRDRAVCRSAPYEHPSLGRSQDADVPNVTKHRRSPCRSAVKKHRVHDSH